MIGKSIYKVPNGKLLKVLLEHDGKTVKSVRLTGDFFLYPEEALEKIEQSLAGSGLEKDALVQKINAAVSAGGVELFGISPEAIADAILMARDAK